MTSVVIYPNGAQAVPDASESSAVSLDLNEFTPFPRLPFELRTKVWEAAIPGPRILRLSAVNSFTKETTRAKTSASTFVVTSTYTFRLVFETPDATFSLLKACTESQQVAIRAFPNRLCSLHVNKQIRFGPLDVVHISNMHQLVQDLKRAKRNGMSIPAAISNIETLAWVETKDLSRDPLFLSFQHPFGFARSLLTNQLHRALGPFSELSGLKHLLIICDDEGATIDGVFSGFDTNDFSKKEMNANQRAMYENARAIKDSITNAYKHGMSQHKWKALPEIKIVARGWPVVKKVMEVEDEDTEVEITS